MTSMIQFKHISINNLGLAATTWPCHWDQATLRTPTLAASMHHSWKASTCWKLKETANFCMCAMVRLWSELVVVGSNLSYHRLQFSGFAHKNEGTSNRLLHVNFIQFHSASFKLPECRQIPIPCISLRLSWSWSSWPSSSWSQWSSWHMKLHPASAEFELRWCFKPPLQISHKLSSTNTSHTQVEQETSTRSSTTERVAKQL